MPRKSDDLTPDEKARIALECLVLELSGDDDASKTVANLYDISPRAVTTLKNQALSGIRSAFEPKSQISEKVDRATISKRLDSLLGSPESSNTDSEFEHEPPENSDEILDGIWNRILEFNSTNEKKIFPGKSILTKISGLSESIVDKWFQQHKTEIDNHVQENRLNPLINRGKRNYKELLGY